MQTKTIRDAGSQGGHKPLLLDQVRTAIQVRHFSLRTEQSYIHWVKRFIFFQNKRHPMEMGDNEVTAFLRMFPPP
ncbi:MAG: phage integrase N-terminal SAM-like domain-containing protein [Burkholderiales bacterium]